MRVDSRNALVSIPRSQGNPAYVSLTVLENRQNLGRTYRPVRTIQCSRRAVLPVDRLLAYVFIEWSRTARSLGATDWKSVLQRVRRTSSPSAKAFSAYDGLPVRRPNRTGGLIGATDWKSVVQGDQNVNSLLSLKQPHLCVCKHRIPPRTPSPGPVVTTTGRGCVSPPGLMNANLLGSISLYCMSGHVWPLQSNSLKRGRPPQPPRPLLPRPKPRWRRGAKRLDGADVRCEV